MTLKAKQKYKLEYMQDTYVVYHDVEQCGIRLDFDLCTTLLNLELGGCVGGGCVVNTRCD
jgi:hypothetical protein